MQANTVRVELVCDRDFKDDCRANTGIIWRGKGDIQPFPAALWPKLAVHPDVWKLAEDQGLSGVPVGQIRSESIEDERKRLGAIEAARVAAESDAKASGNSQKEAEARAAELAGQGVDSVTATVPDQALADTFDYPALTEERQAAMGYEEMRDLAVSLDYGLHYRLSEKNLRTRFAEITADRIAQAGEMVDTTGVDDVGANDAGAQSATKE